MRLPNLVIIGAAKCGTTSMHKYLSLHPEIYMSKRKELDFFIEGRHWSKGIEWYKRNFPADNHAIYGEASPLYASYPLYTGVARRMYQTIPEAKLIYMVRDPIERIISDYLQLYSLRQEHRSFEEAMADLDTSVYIARSRYYTQLSQFLSFYPIESVLIISQEDLKLNTLRVLRQVFRFLGVRLDFATGDFARRYNQTHHHVRRNAVFAYVARAVYPVMRHLPDGTKHKLKRLLDDPFSESMEKPQLLDTVRARLVEALVDDINAFRNLTGNRYEEWSV